MDPGTLTPQMGEYGPEPHIGQGEPPREARGPEAAAQFALGANLAAHHLPLQAGRGRAPGAVAQARQERHQSHRQRQRDRREQARVPVPRP